MSEIHQQLQEKINELERLRKLKSHIGYLNQRLKEEEKALAVMDIMLDKEQRDVVMLEKEGLQSLIRNLVGDREEKLEKEREEYIRASLRFNELFKSVELIRYELDLFSKKQYDTDVIQYQIEQLIKRREEELFKHDVAISHKLKEIFSEIERLHKLMIDVDEAYEAGQLVFGYIRRMENYLHAAKQFRFDHQSISVIHETAYKGRHAFIKFGNELKDVYEHLQFDLEMTLDEFGKAADLFFNDSITGWFVNQKLNTSIKSMNLTRTRLEFLLDKLEVEKMNTKYKLVQLESERKNVIINS